MVFAFLLFSGFDIFDRPFGVCHEQFHPDQHLTFLSLSPRPSSVRHDVRILRTVELLGIQEIRLGRARGRGVRDRQRGMRALEAGVIATAAALEGRGGGFAIGGDGRASPSPQRQSPGDGCLRDDSGGAVVAGRGRGLPPPACADVGGGHRAPFSPAPRSPDPRPPAPRAGVRGWTRGGRFREGEEAAAAPRDGRVVPAVSAPCPLLVGSYDR